jgi:hypothetical protein
MALSKKLLSITLKGCATFNVTGSISFTFATPRIMPLERSI